jgi:hypothetical protein
MPGGGCPQGVHCAHPDLLEHVLLGRHGARPEELVAEAGVDVVHPRDADCEVDQRTEDKRAEPCLYGARDAGSKVRGEDPHHQAVLPVVLLAAQPEVLLARDGVGIEDGLREADLPAGGQTSGVGGEGTQALPGRCCPGARGSMAREESEPSVKARLKGPAGRGRKQAALLAPRRVWHLGAAPCEPAHWDRKLAIGFVNALPIATPCERAAGGSAQRARLPSPGPQRAARSSAPRCRRPCGRSAGCTTPGRSCMRPPPPGRGPGHA